MSGYMFHDEMIKRMAKSTVNPDAQILETAYETGRKQGEAETVKAVLEIIDSEAWSYCDYIVKHENGNGDKQGAASHLADNIREAVLALKGGEQE